MISKIVKVMMVGAALASMSAIKVQALPSIIGDVGFSGGYAVNSPNLATATAFTSFDTIVVNATHGSYNVVPANGTVAAAFTPFTFNPATVPAPSLWSFTFNGLTYTFTATTETSQYLGGVLNSWNIGGTGFASITGFANTPGTWTLTATQTGASFTFASTAGVGPVPDNGTTLILLGAALSGLALIKARLA